MPTIDNALSMSLLELENELSNTNIHKNDNRSKDFMQKQLEGTYLRREAPKQQKYYDDMFALVLNLNVKNS